MTILVGPGEDYAYFVPDIGDTIYDLVKADESEISLLNLKQKR